jgi:hypothetical protein
MSEVLADINVIVVIQLTNIVSSRGWLPDITNSLSLPGPSATRMGCTSRLLRLTSFWTTTGYQRDGLSKDWGNTCRCNLDLLVEPTYPIGCTTQSLFQARNLTLDMMNFS